MDKEKIEIIDIKDAFQKKDSINIIDIADNFKFIILETTGESLIDKFFTVYSTDQYFIVICLKKILLFDRETGKYVRKIGSAGRGPDEYSVTVTNLPIDEQKKVIYARKGYNERYEYDFYGNLISKKKGPAQVFDFVNFGEDTFASFIDNYHGNEKRKLVLFNEQDSIINVFPNFQSFISKDRSMIVFYPDSWFYRINSQVMFCEKFNDTLYTITPNSLKPRFVLNKGLYSFPYFMRGDFVTIGKDYFITEKVIESSRFLFYVFSYQKSIYTALYDKKLQKTIVNDYAADSGNGYIYNIDNFPPLEISSISSKNELICTIDAFKIKSWFDLNFNKEYTHSEHFHKLKNLSESANPVVMISKLKE